MSALKRIAVLGVGQMGRGIVQVAAESGAETVFLWDGSAGFSKKAKAMIEESWAKLVAKGKLDQSKVAGLAARLKPVDRIEEIATADLVVEAIQENESAKVELFKKVREVVRAEAIVASNTSSISITKLGAGAGFGGNFLGIHFMNPVPVMKLVEGIAGLKTSPEVLARAKSWVESLGKTWIQAQDMPGFAVNRILMPMINEGAFALMENLASAKDIDTAMKLGCNFPMGPLELADFVGIDTVVYILDVLYKELGDPKFRACPLLRQYVAAGWFGRKTKRGFFEY